MVLILAEKEVLAKAIADALPGSRNYLGGGAVQIGDYVIVYASGHLLELKMPEDYDPALKNWELDNLPIYFPHWEKKVKVRDGDRRGPDPGERLAVIEKYLKTASMVIHAGDPDDEGQYLIDEILEWFHYKGPVMRMKTGNTTVAGLSRAMETLEDNANHVKEGLAAYARNVGDLIVGVNISRYYSLNNDPVLLSVGRVQTPTLGLVVKRDYLIENHIAVKYYTVKADLSVDGTPVQARYTPRKDDPNLEDGRIIKAEYANSIADMLKQMPPATGKVTVSTEKENPPLPFNQSKLAVYCERNWGYSPDLTLSITQSLRDKYNAISYNRTECQYLSDDQFNEAPGIMAHVVQNIGFRPKEMDMSIKSRAFDSKYVDGSGAVAHPAITPQAVNVDLNALTEQERNVYLAICKYYMAQFMPPAEKSKTKLIVPASDGATLETASTVITKPGYRKIFKEAKPEESSPLSSIPAGEHTVSPLGASVEEGTTSPPPRYTQATLQDDMSHIAKYIEDPKIKEIMLLKDKDKREDNGAIGTTATRASIIKGLLSHNFIETVSKNKIKSTTLGRELIRILPSELREPNMTGLWWCIQEDIKNGSASVETLTDNVMEMVQRVLHTQYPKVDQSLLPQSYIRSRNGQREELGKCPLCGSPVVEGKTGYGCSAWKSGCKFVLWKKPKMPMLKNITFSASDAKTLLNGGKVLKRGLAKRDGGTFDAYLKLENNPGNPYGPSIAPDFSVRPPARGQKSSGKSGGRTGKRGVKKK